MTTSHYNNSNMAINHHDIGYKQIVSDVLKHDSVQKKKIISLRMEI